MDILLEIGLEEIPARFLQPALLDIEKYINSELKSCRVKHGIIKTCGTPRRLVVTVSDVAEKQEDLSEINMGPSKNVAFNDAGEPTKACLGFAKSQKVDVKDLEIIDTDKGEYIGVKKFIKGQQTDIIVAEVLKNLIENLNFPKSMRWSDKKLKFARPIKWILAMLDNKLVEFEIEGIKTELKSNGHRFFGESFEVKSIDDYFKKLRENNVIVDIEERKQLIVNSIKEKCARVGEKVLIDPKLLEEVTNLVEYPYPIVGTFNTEFLEVPQEVLIISMQVHQRYFPILDEKGKLLPKFVVIRNGIEDSEFVKKGNEKVIGARLSDARFFFNEDLKRDLDSFVEQLKSVVYQKDLGTIFEKIERNEKIAEHIIFELDLNDKKEDILRTIKLCKADLVSNMISEKEFTKLQGFMGKVYAEKAGESAEVALGIEEHYYPRYQGDQLPTGIEGAIAGISDKIDTLIGCFGVGLKPTGSKDPYALRRATLGIINVILNSKLEISVSKLIKRSLGIYETKNILKESSDTILNEILTFFKQRVINVLTDKGFRRDIIDSVVNIDFDNLLEVEKKVEVLEKVSKEAGFEDLVNLVKRVENISKNSGNIKVNTSLLKEKAEFELHNFTTNLENTVSKYLEEKKYEQYFVNILEGKEIINNYFNDIMVMDKDEKIKENRLALLKKLYTNLSIVADIKLID